MLFRGGRRELLAPAVAEAVGEGVEVDMMSSEFGDCINRAEDQLLVALAKSSDLRRVLFFEVGYWK